MEAVRRLAVMLLALTMMITLVLPAVTVTAAAADPQILIGSCRLDDYFYKNIKNAGTPQKKLMFINQKLQNQAIYLEQLNGKNPEQAAMVVEWSQTTRGLAQPYLTAPESAGIDYSEILVTRWLLMRLDCYIEGRQGDYRRLFGELIAEAVELHKQGNIFFGDLDDSMLISYFEPLLDAQMKAQTLNPELTAILPYMLYDTRNDAAFSLFRQYWLPAQGEWSEAVLQYAGPVMVLDNIQSSGQLCKEVEGTIYYPASWVLEHSGYSAAATADPLQYAWKGNPDSIQLAIGSETVQRGGESFTLKHSVLPGPFVSEDFFDVCFPQTIESVVVEGANNAWVGEAPTKLRIIGRPTQPYTPQQLSFALGLAGSINIYNLGMLGSPGNAPTYNREDFTNQEQTLTPITAIPRDHWYYADLADGIRNGVLPESWGIADRDSLLSAMALLGAAAQENMAWDLSRKVQLAQWGAACGYLTMEESIDCQMLAAAQLQKAYHSWSEFGKAYLAGFADFGGDGQVYLDREFIVQSMYANDSYRGIPWNLDLVPPPIPTPEPSPPPATLPTPPPPETPPAPTAGGTQGGSVRLWVSIGAVVLLLLAGTAIIASKKRRR